MAANNVLSQEEIDALLQTVDESSEESPLEIENHDTENAKAVIAESEVKTLDFNSSDRIIKGKLPVLDRIYDRAVRSFAGDVYQLTGKDFEIIQDQMMIVTHREFMENLPNPSLMSIYKFKPLRAKAMILFDSTFVYDIVDYYFGGSSLFFAQKDRTDFTATEIRVMDAVAGKLVNHLSTAWKPILPVEIQKVNNETNPQLIHLAEPMETLLVARFTLNFGKESGDFFIIVPYSMVEPIKEQLELGASRPEDEIDPNWLNSLTEELMDVELCVSSVMAQTPSNLGTVTAWQEGDFIPLDIKEIVTLDVEGTPGFTATLGTANDKRALKIIKHISY